MREVASTEIKWNIFSEKPSSLLFFHNKRIFFIYKFQFFLFTEFKNFFHIEMKWKIQVKTEVNG